MNLVLLRTFVLAHAQGYASECTFYFIFVFFLVFFLLLPWQEVTGGDS